MESQASESNDVKYSRSYITICTVIIIFLFGLYVTEMMLYTYPYIPKEQLDWHTRYIFVLAFSIIGFIISLIMFMCVRGDLLMVIFSSVFMVVNFIAFMASLVEVIISS